jgi:uncharacterized membrane protein
MDFMPKGRLDAFADGVFAIVITLLVLDLSVPAVAEGIMPALLGQWQAFLAYIISFAFVGSVWISHSSVTALMKQETPHSYRLTLLMLFFVSLLPFTTKLMSFYLSHPPEIPYGLDLPSLMVSINAIARSALTAPVTIYGLDLLAASLTMNAIMKSAVRTPGMLINEAAENELNALQRRQQVGAIVILATLICGLIMPLVAVIGYIIVSILFFITPTISVARVSLKKDK